MKITINSSEMKDRGLALSRKVAQMLIQLGATVWIELQKTEYYRDIPVVFAPTADCYAGARFAISVGGDGTFINTAQNSSPKGVPVLGINKGTTGFLTELEESEMPLLERLFHDDYQLEQRMMLEYEVYREEARIQHGFALNDVSVQRGLVPRLLAVDIYQDKLFITKWRGDGVIISTPTGSTAYSLSCGGPLIDPKCDCLALVPVGVHSLTSRPTIFGSNAKLIATPLLTEGRVAHLFHDGLPGPDLEEGDSLTVRKAKIRTVVVRMKPESFYHTMRQKLREY